jgi:hypothetical protein
MNTASAGLVPDGSTKFAGGCHRLAGLEAF